MTETIELTWTGTDAVRRRIRLEERQSGGWTRVELRHNGAEWVASGHEIVSDVALESPAAVVRDGKAVIGD